MAEDAWESVATERSVDGATVIAETHRLSVPGGWLYRIVSRNYTAVGDEGTDTVAMVFVPEVTVAKEDAHG